MTEIVHVHRWPGDLIMIEPSPPGEIHLQPADTGLLDQLGGDHDAWFNAEAPDDDSHWLIGARVDVPICITRVCATGAVVLAAILGLWAAFAGLSYLLHLAIRALRHAG
jgi:hypothetical protein